MPYIGKTRTVGNFQVCDAISVVNGQAAYTLQVGGANVAPESANHMLVSLNGILQKPGSSFTISVSTMTFASNLATGDVIDFVQILGNVLDLGTPSDDTVTAAKLNDNVISGQTALTSAPDSTDEFLISDGGTIKRIDASLVGKGKVLQVVTAVDSTLRQTTSGSFTTASNTCSVNITPSATSSKIFVICNTNLQVNDGNDTFFATLFRSISGGSSTNLGNSTTGLISGNSVPGVSANHYPSSMHVLDSPNTTSQCTYQLYVRHADQDGDSGTVSIGIHLEGTSNPTPAHITAFEIGA